VSKILITGASGLIGRYLTGLLRKEGHTVYHLGRSKRSSDSQSYVWDIEKKFIEPGALEDKDVIIHLAGAGVAEKRWTDARKKEIVESRTLSTRLLQEELKQRTHQVKTVVCASAIGYYGFDDRSHEFVETDGPGNDFLSQVVKVWEDEQDKLALPGIRLVKVRVGIVLSAEGGALPEMAKPIRYLVGSPLGSGDQNLSWIHIHDVCQIFVQAVRDESMNGAYNGVGPYAVTNREMTHAIADAMAKPLIAPAVPPFVLKALLGEMASLALRGSKVSAKKISATGFKFQFVTLESALRDLIRKRI
jgi:uncharacterized protein (TIGR01777 family)